MKLIKLFFWLRKHKKRPTPRFFPVIGVFFAFAIILFLNTIHPQADERDWYSENVKFDSEGNLLITTRDLIASTDVRYKTIGWTISSEDKNVSVRLPQMQNGESKVDPSDDRYIYSYFKIDAKDIYSAIEDASTDWLMSLYLKGGTVKLDAIMTVIENEVVMGSMDREGNFYGEVFDDYNEIADARAWRDKEGLKTHFNKSMKFVPDPDEIIELPDEDKTSDDIVLKYGYEYLKPEAEVALYSKEFDVEKGIPCTEDILGTGQFQEFYYTLTLRHVTGHINVPVEVTVLDENRTNFTIYVSREYSYYRAMKLKYGWLDKCVIKSEAVKNGELELLGGGDNSFSYEIKSHKGDYVRTVTEHLEVNEGLSLDEIFSLAEANAKENVLVRNDKLVINGKTCSLDGWQKGRTSEVKIHSGPKLVRTDAASQVPLCANGPKTVAARVYYTGNKPKDFAIAPIPDVVVHTPVVCKITLSDDISHNQEENPTKNPSFVLGRKACVTIAFEGKHLGIKGYGHRDYSKYVKKAEVSFPFEVIKDKNVVNAGTWIELLGAEEIPGEADDGQKDAKIRKLEVIIPKNVLESDYEIKARVQAINAGLSPGGDVGYESKANLSISNYGAKDKAGLTVIGRLYDLQIDKIFDSPRWDKGSKIYPCGPLDIDGNYSKEKSNAGLSPVISDGSSLYAARVTAPGLGYTMSYSIKTIGNMRDADDGIIIVPSFYYISRDGSTRKSVNLYSSKNLKKILPEAIFLDSKCRTLLENGLVQKWKGEYKIGADAVAVDSKTDLPTYIKERGGRISFNDKVFLKEGYLLVNFAVTSVDSGKLHLSYVNSKNSPRGYCNENKLQGFKYERTDKDGNVFRFKDGDFLIFDMKNNLYQDYDTEGTH